MNNIFEAINENLDLMRRMGEKVKLINEGIDDDTIKVTDYFDISAISEEDIKSITNDMRAFLQGNGFGGNIFWNDESVIVEESQKTIPVEELSKNLVQLGFQPWQIVSTIYANNIKVAILYVDIAKNTDVIIKEMLSFGWTKSHISRPMVIHGIFCRVMDFDPIEQPTITNEVHQYEFIYHSTPSTNVESILKGGIQPRSENDYMDYPPRAHYTKGEITKHELAPFTWRLFNVSKKCMDGDYTILRIKTSSVPDEIEFYGDPRYDLGVFAKDIVPPTSIEIFGKIKYLDKNRYCGEQIQVLLDNDTMKD